MTEAQLIHEGWVRWHVWTAAEVLAVNFDYVPRTNGKPAQDNVIRLVSQGVGVLCYNITGAA